MSLLVPEIALRATIIAVMPAKAGIQYAAPSRIYHWRLGILGHPLELVIGRRESADPVAGDDGRDEPFAHVPRGFTRRVGAALAGSSGQGCRG